MSGGLAIKDGWQNAPSQCSSKKPPIHNAPNSTVKILSLSLLKLRNSSNKFPIFFLQFITIATFATLAQAGVLNVGHASSSHLAAPVLHTGYAAPLVAQRGGQEHAGDYYVSKNDLISSIC